MNQTTCKRCKQEVQKVHTVRNGIYGGRICGKCHDILEDMRSIYRNHRTPPRRTPFSPDAPERPYGDTGIFGKVAAAFKSLFRRRGVR